MALQLIQGPLDLQPDSLTKIQQKLNTMFGELYGAAPLLGKPLEIKLTVSSSDGTVDPEPIVRSKINRMMAVLSFRVGYFGVPFVPASVFGWTSVREQFSLTLLNYFFRAFYAGDLMSGVISPPASFGPEGWNDDYFWDDHMIWSDAA